MKSKLLRRSIPGGILRIFSIAIILACMLLMLVPFEALAQQIVDSNIGAATSFRFPFQNHSFYDDTYNNNFVFFASGTDIGWRYSSNNGNTWSSKTTLGIIHLTNNDGSNFSIWFYGTHVWLAFAEGSGSKKIKVRRAIVGNGTITWEGASWLTAWTSPSTLSPDYPYISVDSGGYPWIGFSGSYAGPSTYGMVTKSSTNDGTWATATGFPYDLWGSGLNSFQVSVIPLTDLKVVAIAGGSWGGAAYRIMAKRWTGSAWGSAAYTTSYLPISAGYNYDAVRQDDDVHVIALEQTSYDIWYTKYSYSTNSFSAETTIYSAATSTSAPAMSRDNANNLHVFWENDPTDDHMFYAKYIYNTSTWVSYYDLITEIDLLPATGYYLNTDYTCDESRVGVYYIAGSAILKFKLLSEVFQVQTKTANPVGTTSATLQGEIISLGFGSATTRGFLYNNTPSEVGATDWHEHGTFNVGVFTHGIIGLIQGENYYYIAYASNNWGIKYGLWVQFTTGGGSSSFIVTTLVPTDVLGSSATLKAEIMGIPPGVTCTKRGFEWGKTVDTMTTWQGNGTFGLGEYSHGITGLEEGKLYYVRAFIGNSTETVYGDYVGFFSSYSSGNANYFSDIVVRETCGNSYTQLPVIASVDNTYLVANYFMKASALDTDIQVSGIHTPYLPTDDKVVFIVPYIGPYEVVTATYLLGFTPEQAYFNTLVGLDGNITMADDPALELGDTDFEVKLRGYIDTDYTPNKNLVYKESAFKLYISADGNVTAEGNFTTGLKTITASSVSSDTHTIGVTCNGVNMKLYVDGVEKGNVTTGGGNITDNGNSWYLMTGNSTPNLEYYRHYVDSVMVVEYQPNAIISNTVLPDLLGNTTRNGVVNWGTNTVCITVTVGPLTPLTPPIVVSADLVPPDVVGVINPPEPVDSTSVGVGVPLLYGLFDWGANVMGIPIMFLWSALAAIVSIAVGIGTAKLTKDERGEPSVTITAIAVGFALGAMSAIGGGIVGVWFIIIYLFIAVPTVMLHSKFSIG